MSTATKAPKSKQDTQSAVDRLVSDAETVNEAADEMLLAIGGGRPSPEQMTVLRIAGIDAEDLPREHGRIGRVLQFMQQAGTDAEYQAANKAALEAARNERQQAPELEKQIVALRQQLDGLGAARATVQAQLEPMIRARGALRDPTLLPAHVARRWNDARVAVDAKYHDRIAELEQIVVVATGLKGMPASSRAALLHCEGLRPDLLRIARSGMYRDPVTATYQREQVDPETGREATEFHGTQSTKVDEGAWTAYVKRRVEVELPAAERQLAELRAEREAELVVVDRLRDRYIEKL
jgi:hypothetical protein